MTMSRVRFRDAAVEWGEEQPEMEGVNWTDTPASLAYHLSNGAWEPAAHLKLISDKVAECQSRQVFLIVTLPPRHGKSELISHWTPVWYLKRFPWKRIILTSYQEGLAAEFGGMVKDSITEHREELGFDLTQDTHAKARWKLRGYGGGMMSTGVGGSITGRGGDLVIIDDPIKNDREAMSQAYRNSIFRWYQATLRTRLEPGGSIIIVMTRWHEDDLVGRLTRWLQDQEGVDEELTYRDNWEVINMPAFAEPNDPLGRAEGEPLWPARYDKKALLQIRNAQVDTADEREAIASSTFWWSALYQGRPVPEGGGTFHEDWWQWYDADIDIVKDWNISQVVQVWDTAFKETQKADRSVCITLGVIPRRGYAVLDCYVGRPNFPGLVKQAEAQNDKWSPRRVAIEDKASGISLIQQLRRDTTIPIRAIKILPKDDKKTRAESVAGIVEAGRCYLPKRAHWLADFLYETSNFPRAAHDDIVDAFVHGLRLLRARIPTGSRMPETEEGTSRWAIQ